MGKNVFNGCTTSFWFDRWLGEVALWNIRVAEVNPELVHSTVFEIWDGSSWKWSVFQHLLPNQTLLKLSAKALNTLHRKADTFTWQPSVNGLFSVRTAYHIQEQTMTVTEGPPEVSKSIWKNIWQVQTTFVWLADFTQ